MNGPVLHALEGLTVGLALCVRPGPALTITIRNAGRGRALAGPVAFVGRIVADLLPLAIVGGENGRSTAGRGSFHQAFDEIGSILIEG